KYITNRGREGGRLTANIYRLTGLREQGESTVAGPLAGVRIVEFVGKGPGPFAAMVMADLGADVIRLHRRQPPEVAMDPRYDLVARGRGSLYVDLKEPADVELALDLVAAG